MSIDRALAAMIDHTLLRPDALGDEIDRLCDEARSFGFRTVCVQPVFVARAARNLAGSAIGVTAVVAFPHGATTTVAQDPMNGWTYGPGMTTIVFKGSSCNQLTTGAEALHIYYGCGFDPIK